MTVKEKPKIIENLYTGFFTGKVVAINPTKKDLETLLKKQLREDVNYVDTNYNDYLRVRLDFWIKEDESERLFKAVFFITKEITQSASGNKVYINSAGVSTWKTDDTELPESFVSRGFRRGYVGEPELYEFIRVWFHNMDYSEETTNILLDWDLLQEGNFSQLKKRIKDSVTGGITALAIVKEKDGIFFQEVFKKGILPDFMYKFLFYKDYDDPDIQRRIKNSSIKDLKGVEKTILKILDSYGCKDQFTLGNLKPFNYERRISTRKASM